MRWVRVAVITIWLIAIGGCGRSPATRFYALTPVPGSTAAAPASTLAPAIGVRAVDLPAELDRPQIVTRSGANAVQLAEFDRWSAPLRDIVSRLIAENLAAQLPTDRVAVYPWMPGDSIDQEVTVEVVRFEGRLGGPCVLEARWRVAGTSGRGGRVIGRTNATEHAGADYASVVAAQSRLVGRLSADIAAAIRSNVAAAPQTSN
ncbi:MAG TPA: PqiC family protein [Methylomirabilota bacterium]|jgi:hypothetical protein